MDLFETKAGDNTPEYSVSQISSALKKTVEENFSHVRVRGELGRVTRAASGHVYLDLKDDKAVINCNIWRPIVQRLDFQPEEGMEVVATGKLSTYAPRSGYNLIIEKLEIAGEGALMALLEKRKKALASEGLFDESRKQHLPYLPQKIGVITSRTGAVIRDILHRLEDRFPREVLLWPVAVQGKGSAEEVAAAVQGFNSLPADSPLRPDVIIVARGGGSIEDLWGFNEEVVVRAVAASQIPVISAVGHETDTTLIDYVADRRAPTPTAAAEMAVPVRADLLAFLGDLDARRIRAVQKLRENASRRLMDLSRGLPKATELLATPSQRLDLATSRLDGALQRQVGVQREKLARVATTLTPYRFMAKARQDFAQIAPKLNANGFLLHAKTKYNEIAPHFTKRQIERSLQAKNENVKLISANLTPAFTRKIERERQVFQTQAKLLEALSYTRVLDRGFALVLDENGHVLKTAEETRTSKKITIRQKDGENKAEVKG